MWCCNPIQYVNKKSTKRRGRHVHVGSELTHSETKERKTDTANALSRGAPEGVKLLFYITYYLIWYENGGLLFIFILSYKKKVMKEYSLVNIKKVFSLINSVNKLFLLITFPMHMRKRTHTCTWIVYKYA